MTLPALAALLALCTSGVSPSAKHTFALGTSDFLLDGKPFQIMSGEMHPARIPEPYWRQRIEMAKAMGLNTVACYVFWNYHEPEEGKFDFSSEGHDLGKFFNICQEEGMFVLLRPGPYCCGEWDFGGMPTYLLKYPDIKVRCMDPRYIKAVGRYLAELAKVVAPYQVSRGGPILMLQLENEYGSYGNDRKYIAWLHDFWRAHGIDVPFYTADGPTDFMLEAGSYPGCAVGLDSGSSLADFDEAHKMNPGVPAFSSETYPGWLTHWGEQFAGNSIEGITGELKFLLDNHKSFNLYVVHGGTNFGFTAGANSGGHGYEPDITSYDYDAPITEQGRVTPKYEAMRNLIGSYRTSPLPSVPDPIPAMDLPPIHMEKWTSLWDHLPMPVEMPQPKPFEALGQSTGLILYRTKLVGHKSGRLVVTDLHDWGLVYVDGRFVGVLDRRQGVNSIELPRPVSATPTLDILVEGMGHINFAQEIIDRKGITDRVTLDGMTLMDWQAFQMPLSAAWVQGLGRTEPDDRKGVFFRGSFALDSLADTYLDMSGYKKGYVWVNGHNLGRYWDIGPQKRLYCPAPWLKRDENRVIVLDLLQADPADVTGARALH
jgi:hypothetical protein